MPYSYYTPEARNFPQDGTEEEKHEWYKEYREAQETARQGLETVIGLALYGSGLLPPCECGRCEEHDADAYAGLFELIQSLPEARRERWLARLRAEMVR